MLIRNKDGHHIRPIVVDKLKFLLLWLVHLDFFLSISETNGSVGRWETKHFIGMEFPLLSEPLPMISLATDFRTKGAVHSTLVIAPWKLITMSVSLIKKSIFRLMIASAPS